MALFYFSWQLGLAFHVNAFYGGGILSSGRFTDVSTSSSSAASSSPVPIVFRSRARSHSLYSTIGVQNSGDILRKKRSWLISLIPKQPLLRIFKTKATNVWGIVFGMQCWSLMLVWMMGMILFMPFKILFPDLDRNGILIDAGGRWWSRLVTFPHSIPRIDGYKNLPPRTEPCLYIANHASWLDIPILGGYLPPMKFVCKKELTKVVFLVNICISLCTCFVEFRINFNQSICFSTFFPLFFM